MHAVFVGMTTAPCNGSGGDEALLSDGVREEM